jgi:hypothetical protein
MKLLVLLIFANNMDSELQQVFSQPFTLKSVKFVISLKIKPLSEFLSLIPENEWPFSLNLIQKWINISPRVVTRE